ncbi:MAG: nucleotidyltransferase domain-containing protein [archaeon]
MNMQVLFSTDEREKIMNYLLYNPSKEINLNEIARQVKVSPGQVHKYVSILRKLGIVKSNFLKESPLVNSLRLTQNLVFIEKKKIVKKLKKGIPEIKGIGVYGSWAKGTNYEDSDLDVWIKIEKTPSDKNLYELKKEIEKSSKVAVDLMALTPEKLLHLKEKSESFYFSLFDTIHLWGESL